MPYDNTAANVFAVLGVTALIAAMIRLFRNDLFRGQASSLTSRDAIRVVTGLGLLLFGVASILLADLIEGRGWSPVRIAAALAWLGAVVAITWGGRLLVRDARAREKPDEADEADQ